MNKSLFKATVRKCKYPITVTLSSGDKLVVRHPENIDVRDIFVEESNRETVIVIFEEGSEGLGLNILEPQDIVAIATTRRNGRKL